MKIVITGGTGFIARNLSEQLGTENTILCLSRKQLDLLDAVKVKEYLKNERFDVVIHTATYDVAAVGSTKDPTKVLENNLKMFFNLVRCQDDFGKMIYFGSGAEYSREHWVPKMKEEYFDKYVPTDQYGLSKYIMTKYALLSNNIFNLRLFGMFGKYDDWRTRLIPNVCYLAVMNRPIKISQNKYCDFLYMDDLVKIVSWFIKNKPKYKVYNVCTGKTVAFKTIAEKIVKISGRKAKVDIGSAGLGKEYSGDNSLLIGELNDFTVSSFDKSIKALYEWYKIDFGNKADEKNKKKT